MLVARLDRDALALDHQLGPHRASMRNLIDEQNLTVEARERKHRGLDNAAIVSGRLDVSTHEAKVKLIDAQNLSVEVRERKHQGLSNVRSLLAMTKHKAKALTGAAVTVNDQTLAASAMAKVDKKGTKAGKEMEDLKEALTGTEVTKRVAYGLTVKDQERRRFVIHFRDTMKTYNLAVSQHDHAVRAAKKTKLALEEHSNL